jgi:YfiH family protein
VQRNGDGWGGDWSLKTTRRGRFCRLPALEHLGLRHGFSCRDLASDPEASEAQLAGGLGLEALPRARLDQEHSAVVHAVARQPPATVTGDGLVSRRGGPLLRLQTADCLPVLLLDPESGTYGVVHAGWRGTLAGVLGRALEVMAAEGARPGGVWVGMGPGIRTCCFEIGDEVGDAFRTRWRQANRWLRPGPGQRRHLDLVAANAFQAARAGVPPEQILEPGLCTRCRVDLFYSYRGDGRDTGRIITLAGVPAPSR